MSTWRQSLENWLNSLPKTERLSTVIWLPSLGARLALMRHLAGQGAGLLPRIVVPMQSADAMLPFGIEEDLWPTKAEVMDAKITLANALHEADKTLTGTALAHMAGSAYKLVEGLALAHKQPEDLWHSTSEDVAEHFRKNTETLREALEAYDTWVQTNGRNPATLAAVRWQKLAKLTGWHQAAVPLGWQTEAQKSWLQNIPTHIDLLEITGEENPQDTCAHRALHLLSTPAEEAAHLRHLTQVAMAEGRTPVAIAVGDAPLAELIEAELAAHGLTPKSGFGGTLATTLLGQFIQALLAVLASPTALSLATFTQIWAALNPACAIGLSELEKRYLRGPAPSTRHGWQKRFERAAEREALNPEAPENTLTCLHTLAALMQPAAAPLATWSITLSKHLQTLVPTWEERDEAEALQTLLITLQNSQKTVAPTLFAAFMKSELDAIPHGPQADVNAPVLTGRLAALHGAKTVLIAGLNQPQWSPTRPHPWLSNKQLVTLGIPSGTQARTLANQQFTLLWNGLGATHITGTRSTFGADGTPLTPATPWQKMQAAYPPQKQASDASQQATKYNIPDTRPPALQLAPTTYSPSLLEDALACPYKAALTRHFGLREWEAFNALPNAREFGLILHSALEDFWQTWPSRTVTPADRGAAEDALTTFFAKHLKRQAEELTPLWQPRLTRLAPALVEDWIESGEAGYHVQAAEEEITEVVSGLTVKARVDRLDVNTKTNALTVIDFKSGSTPSPKQLKTGEKPQLAIEGALFQAQEKDLENLRYVRLKGYGKEMILTEDMADVPAAIAAAEEGLGRLKNVLTTSWQATPNLSEGGREKAGHCTYCPHNGVCRFQEIGW